MSPLPGLHSCCRPRWSAECTGHNAFYAGATDCDVDMEQKELALQWARAKFYHEELAAQGSTKPAVLPAQQPPWSMMCLL